MKTVTVIIALLSFAAGIMARETRYLVSRDAKLYSTTAATNVVEDLFQGDEFVSSLESNIWVHGTAQEVDRMGRSFVASDIATGWVLRNALEVYKGASARAPSSSETKSTYTAADLAQKSIDNLSTIDWGVKFIDFNKTYASGSIKAEIHNGNSVICKFSLVFLFYEKDQYVINREYIYSCYLSAGEKRVFSKEIILDMKKYNLVTSYGLRLEDFK